MNLLVESTCPTGGPGILGPNLRSRMPPQLPDYSDSVRAAVADYWDVRRSQADESEGRGVFIRRAPRLRRWPRRGLCL